LDASEEDNVTFADFKWFVDVMGWGMSDGAWASVFPVDFCGDM
jgi:hypothetical protein